MPTEPPRADAAPPAAGLSDPGAAATVCAHVFYSGMVQGVGFRFTTVRLARGFALGGTVRNLPDGRVELVAEGGRREIERFLAELAQRFAGYLERVELDWEPARGGPARLEVVY